MTRSLSAGQYHMMAIAECQLDGGTAWLEPKMRSGFGVALNPAGVRKRGRDHIVFVTVICD